MVSTGIAVDSSGDAYVTGSTGSGFPTTTYSGPPGGGAFVTELNPGGSALVYSAVLGGGDANAIAVDSSGDAFVTGLTYSSDFPTTAYFGPASGGAFVTELNPAGSALVYSAVLGGGGGYGIAVDSSGDAYVTGSAVSDFPTTAGAFQTTSPNGGAFVAKVNANGTALLYSTYLGGRGPGNGIAVDGSGNAYVTGYTNSSDFPTTPGAF